MAGVELRVEGLAELRRALKAAEGIDGGNDLRDGLKDAAGIVATNAKTRAPSGAARDSIRSTAGGNRAYVIGGKAKVPYYGWLDFGNRNPVSGQSRSVGPWAHSGKGPKGGRFIYPALDAKERQVVEAVASATDRALDRLNL